MAKQSNLGRYRAEREDQVSERRTAIIDAAEELFLAGGITDTTMADIAERADVSRVTLYRYFSERDHLSFEVAGRMLGRLAAAGRAAVAPDATPIEAARAGLRALITDYHELRDAYRFLAMFDTLSESRPQSPDYEQWFRSRSHQAYAFDDDELAHHRFDPDTTVRRLALSNMVMGTLTRFAVLSDAIDRDQGVGIDVQLDLLEEMALDYFDRVIAPAAEVVA